MIRHLFKLIWNKKKSHSLLIVEIWASFLVLFGLASMISYNVSNYLEPLGFEYENVWAIGLNNNQDTVAVQEKIQSIFQQIKGFSEVESTSRMSDSYPFSYSYNGRTVKYKTAESQVTMITADENLAKVIRMPLIEGRWYRNTDSIGKYLPVVINQKAKEDFFENENPIGKILTNSEGKGVWQISGVVENYKDKAEFMENKATMFELLKADQIWNKAFLIRVKPGTDAVFEARLVKTINNIAKGWSTEVIYLSDLRQQHHDTTLVPVIIFLILCSFLLINVGLGLFGILNLSITKRKGEIGLRRAMGATEGKITNQFLGEIWVLTVLSIIIGIVMAVQFPLMNVFDIAANIYIIAILVSILIIFLIVTICAWYPSRQAARIQPALALHEE